MKTWTDEDFFAAVEAQTEPLTGEDRKWLLEILKGKPFQKMAKVILFETDEMKNRFLRFNLGDEKERAAASTLQGEIAAYPRLFGLMVDEALKKEDPKDETPPENDTAERRPAGP